MKYLAICGVFFSLFLSAAPPLGMTARDYTLVLLDAIRFKDEETAADQLAKGRIDNDATYRLFVTELGKTDSLRELTVVIRDKKETVGRRVRAIATMRLLYTRFPKFLTIDEVKTQVFPVLAEALSDPSAEVRARVMGALHPINWATLDYPQFRAPVYVGDTSLLFAQAAKLFADSDSAVRTGAVAFFGHLPGSEATLLTLLKEPYSPKLEDVHFHASVLNSLRRGKVSYGKHMELVRPFLECPDLWARYAALELIGAMEALPPDELVEIRRLVTQDSSEWVRRGAIDALKSVKAYDKKSRAAVRDALLDDKEEYVRVAATGYFAEANKPRAVWELAEILGNVAASTTLRWNCGTALVAQGRLTRDAVLELYDRR